MADPPPPPPPPLSKYPDFRSFDCRNMDSADTISPMLFDEKKAKIWDGADHGFYISPGSIRSIDLNVIFKPERAPGIMILGCSVKGTSDQPSDSDHKMYYSPSSQKVATGTYKDRKFTVDSPATSNLEVAAATALQDAYAKLNSQSVAKFLVSVANLMSPEVV